MSNIINNKIVKPKIDKSYATTLTDLFNSGLVAKIGTNAFTVLLAIKHHADFNTGTAYPGMRAIAKKIGMSPASVHSAIKKLEANHLVRVAESKGFKKSQTYVAREVIELKIGKLVLCNIAIDYIPRSIKEDLRLIESAFSHASNNSEVLARVDIIPALGFTFDANKKIFSADINLTNETIAPEKPKKQWSAREALQKKHCSAS